MKHKIVIEIPPLASWKFKRVFNTILYKNEFQNPQTFQQTISLFPEHSTLERDIIQHGLFSRILSSQQVSPKSVD
jgi:hypothetical protein